MSTRLSGPSRRRLGALGLALLAAACTPAVPKEPAAIEALGQRAAQAGHADALAQLQGWAEAGSVLAQRELGLALLRQRPDPRPGLSWLDRAARAGDAEAAFQWADIQRLGRHGLQPDPEAARPWFEQAARAGHAEAALELARLLSQGAGMAHDEQEASRWLLRAAHGGSPAAMFLLAGRYEQGQGLGADAAAARRWLEQAADRHYPPAIQAYAQALEEGRLGLARDPVQAAELLREAGEERHNRWNMR